MPVVAGYVNVPYLRLCTSCCKCLTLWFDRYV